MRLRSFLNPTHVLQSLWVYRRRSPLNPTSDYQTQLLCRIPTNFYIFRFIIRTTNKQAYGSLGPKLRNLRLAYRGNMLLCHAAEGILHGPRFGVQGAVALQVQGFEQLWVWELRLGLGI